MRENERGYVPTPPAQVRGDYAFAEVTLTPLVAGVDQNPSKARRSQRDRIALTDVDHMDLEACSTRPDEWPPERSADGGRRYECWAPPMAGNARREERD